MVALSTSSYLLQLNTVTCTLAKAVLSATVTVSSDSRPLRNLSSALSARTLAPRKTRRQPLHYLLFIVSQLYRSVNAYATAHLSRKREQLYNCGPYL